MKVIRLRTNHLKNPLGFLMEQVVLSYMVVDTQAKGKKGSRILVARESSFREVLYDSGVRSDIDERGFLLPLRLDGRTRYYWKVFVTADSGEQAWSDPAWFETAKDPTEEWHADFITQSFSQTENPVFFKEVFLKEKPASNRCYVVGLGVYELYLNSRKVGDEYLLPGIHDYDSWLQYQTYELPWRRGKNLVEIRCGHGWYKGEYGLIKPYQTDKEHACIAEFRLVQTNGSETVFGTDLSWKVRRNQVTFDGIYPGEVYDAAYEDSPVANVKKAAGNPQMKKKLTPRLSPPLTVHEKLVPTLLVSPKGEYILDMGQNMVGWVSFRSALPRNTRIHMEFGEILQDGCFYRANLRTAKAEFTYIASGKKEEVRPHYTFYGFRYVKIEGFPGAPSPTLFRGLVIHSDMEQTAFLHTSDARLNRLIKNVFWGMKGNFLDTATDCPQRDERMGWTGDAQIFSDTACFLMETYAFYRKYLHDLALEQQKHQGSVTYVVPAHQYPFHGAAVWGDAATVIPWTMYVHYGDTAILSEQYESMKAWVAYMHREDVTYGNQHLWMTGNQLGDWLALDGAVSGGVYGATDRYFISSAYYYYSTSLLAKTAKVLKKTDDAERYGALAGQIKEAFIHEFFTPSGRLAFQTQTAYAIAICMDLLPENGKKSAYAEFRTFFLENGCTLTTGFAGTPFLCPALVKSGNVDLAFRLLMRREYPGWLYEVDMGATTIWERWNSVLPDGKISGTSMNSLNHYAYGSILSWVIRDVVGFAPQEEVPGGKSMRICPHPDSCIRHCSGTFLTPFGLYHVAWKRKNKQFILQLTIPFDATADVVLPLFATPSDDDSIHWEFSNGVYMASLSAGSYTIHSQLVREYEKKYSLDYPANVVMKDKKMRNIILAYFPSFAKHVPWAEELPTMEDILRSPFVLATEEEIQKVKKEINALNVDGAGE